MKQGNRKHIRLLAMAMSLAVVGMLAAFMALAAQPAPASAQDPCDGPLAPILPQCQGSTPTPTPTPGPDTTPDAGDMITSDSTSGGAAPEFQVVIGSLPMNLAVGGSIVLYLEDDYQEPATIPASSVYFVAENPTNAPTGNGARVYTTIAPNIDTDDYFDADKDDISIRVFIPDMCTNATDACEGANGPMQGQKLTMVVEDNSGIKNPTEAGSHSAAFAILGPTDGVPGPAAVDKDFELPTWAKISLSDVDNIRDYELTITGSGFNDGTTAAVYVLHDPSVGSVAFDNSANEAALCERIVNRGTLAGGSLVGSDDRVSVTFVVTAPTFGPGNTNYICMVDGEGRMSHTDVERFHLEHSIRVSPSTVSAGDTATVFAQDYPNAGASFSSLRIAGSAYAPDGTSLSAFITSHSAIGPDGDATLTFEVPDGREGTLRLDARWGNIEASTRITVREGGFTEPQFVGPVSSLAASADGQEAGAVRLIWSPAENAQVHFVIYVKSEELYAGNYASARMAPFSGSEGVITGLDGGTTYHFNVIGMRWNWVDYGAVWGGWTDWASATPVGADATSDVEPPLTEPQFVGRVANLTASADGQEAGAVRATWSEADNAQVHFVIYVKSEELYANNYASTQMAPFAGSEGLITGLDGGTSYHFNVIGMRWNWVQYGAVWGGWAEWAPATPGKTDATTEFNEGSSAVRTVAENTVRGQDIGDPVDATGDDLEYILTGDDASSFSIVSGTGQLQTRAALDHETKAAYAAVIIAFNPSGGSATISVTIHVDNVEEPGTVTLSSGRFTVGETIVATLTDPDGSIAETRWLWEKSLDKIAWTAIGGATSAEYTPVLEDVGHYLRVTGSYSDGEGPSKAASGISDEPVPPVFNEGSSAVRTVAENTVRGQDIGDPVDATGDDLEYILTGDDASSFSIVSGTGQLQTRAALDHETKAAYAAVIIAFNPSGGSATISVTIHVDNVEEPGTVTLSSGRFTVGETIVATLTDPDGSIAETRWLWEKSLDKIAWTAIGGATSAEYTPVLEDVGHYLRVTGSYSDGEGPSKAASGISDEPVPPVQAPRDDRAVLTTLYRATDGANWANNTNWLSDLSLDQWHGVIADDDGRVTFIFLNRNRLLGRVPSELGRLSNLRSLSLQHNLLVGEIPSTIGNLPDLQGLYLGGNLMTGELPTALGDLTNLANLDVSGNQLAGELPTALGKLTNLKNLDVSGNQLAGVIPTWLGNLTTLTLLDLDYNQFTGHIPEELGNLTKLEYLELDENNLEGEIPESLASLSNLERLELSGNSFTGCIPAALRDVPENDLLELGLPFCDGSQPDAEKTIDFASLRNAGYLEHNMPQAAAAIKALLWVADSITLSEKDAVERLVYIAVFYPDVFNVLIRLPWIVDSMTEAETSVVDSLGSIASYDEAAAERIIQMPFLEAIDPPDVHAMRSLWIFAFVDEAGFQQILSHFTLNGGIDDHDAKIVALLHSSPSLRSVLLDPDRVEDIEVEDRIIQLQLSGDVVLAIIRPQPGNAGSMDLLANAVRSAQAFIGEPFPVNYVALLFGEDVIPGFAGTNFGTHIAVLPQFDADDGSHGARTAGLLIAHEVAHYYWRGNQGWIDEGASEFVASVAENARTGEPIEADQGPCAYARNIAALERLDTSRNEEAYGCNYSLGERIFLDLHRTLAHGEFRQGFRRLYLTSEMEADPDDPGRTRSDIERVRNAFPPKASAVIARWYDGTEPYDLSNLDVRPVDPSLPVINGRIEEAYITLGPEGPAVSTLSPERKADHVYLHLEYSYRVSGGHYDVPLEIVQYYEDGFTFGRRTVTITAEEGYIGGGLRLGVGAPPGEPWASGRYWVYVYDRDRKVAEVQYEVTP